MSATLSHPTGQEGRLIMSESSVEVEDEPEEDDKQAAIDLKMQGNEAFKQKNLDRALELYDMAIKKDPTQISFYNNKAGRRFSKSVKMFACFAFTFDIMSTLLLYCNIL